MTDHQFDDLIAAVLTLAVGTESGRKPEAVLRHFDEMRGLLRERRGGGAQPPDVGSDPFGGAEA